MTGRAHVNSHYLDGYLPMTYVAVRLLCDGGMSIDLQSVGFYEYAMRCAWHWGQEQSWTEHASTRLLGVTACPVQTGAPVYGLGHR